MQSHSTSDEFCLVIPTAKVTADGKEFLMKQQLQMEIIYIYLINIKIMKMPSIFRSPYMDSFNAGYGIYQNKSHDGDLKKIDNTEM